MEGAVEEVDPVAGLQGGAAIILIIGYPEAGKDALQWMSRGILLLGSRIAKTVALKSLKSASVMRFFHPLFR
jgi:hypothetical protein